MTTESNAEQINAKRWSYIFSKVPPSVTAKLRKVIEKEYQYFILTGSDSRNLEGCCPSDDVAAANRLVEAGILQSWQPSASDDACPSTVYAFNGEIETGKLAPSFSINACIRETILSCIQDTYASKWKLPLNILRLLLLAFAVISIVVLFTGLSERFRGELQAVASGSFKSPAKALGQDSGVVVCFFEAVSSCQSCRDKNAFTIKALDTHFQKEMADGRVALLMIGRRHPRNIALRKEFGISVSSVVLVGIEDGKEVRKKVLVEAYAVISEKRFIEMIRAELTSFMRSDR